jgi:hypothetical protein
MARNFVIASSQSLSDTTTPPVTALPFTFAAWVKLTAIGGVQTLAAVSEGSTAENWVELIVDTGGNLLAQYHGNGGSTVSANAGVVSSGTWLHAGAVFTSASDRTAYWDGSGVNNTTAANALGTVNYTTLGTLRYVGTFVDFLGGDLAEAAMWNVALTAAEMASLAKGMSPQFVRPAALVGYWPLLGNESPEVDRTKQLNHLTLTNTPTKAAHPRVYMPVAGR